MAPVEPLLVGVVYVTGISGLTVIVFVIIVARIAGADDVDRQRTNWGPVTPDTRRGLSSQQDELRNSVGTGPHNGVLLIPSSKRA
jgi:hypothetical protein